MIKFENNLVDVDPRFVNLKQQDFRLQPESPAFSLGFKQIPVGNIGLYTDEFRDNRLP